MSRIEYLKHKESARAIISQKIFAFNEHYKLSFKRVTIRNQKSRWGSCSKKGNLNFNYRLALLPERLIDYIVVHELCHLKEFNHGKNFWDLVGQKIPDHASRRRELKHIR